MSLLFWSILFGLLFVLAFAFLFWLGQRDRRYLKKPVRDVLGKEMRREIEKEREEFDERKKQFTQVLEKIQKKNKTP